MQPEKLTHFKKILLDELQKHTEHVRNDQAAALELSDDGVKDTVDLSCRMLARSWPCVWENANRR